jgi:hypothetical protein
LNNERLFTGALCTGIGVGGGSGIGTTGGLGWILILFISLKRSQYSVIVYVFPMLRLHDGHIGKRFSMVVSPPLLSGLLWPTSKVKGVIMFLHHITWHFDLKFSPLYVIHTI